LPVDPRDLDLLVDHVAAAELADGLREAVVSDEARWDRGDVRAVRRILAVIHGVEVEIMEGVEAVGPTGDAVAATPDLDHVDRIIVSGRPIPVLPLPAMQVLFDATGNRERAAMVAKALGAAQTSEGWEWTPRELRQSFVSLLSDERVPLEVISRLVGHRSTTVTETVYRKQLRPVIEGGADAMDRIFPPSANSGP